MTLLETQRRMAAAVMAPTLGRHAADFIKPSRLLSPRARLEIYRRSYWSRLLDSLREDFPGLARAVGPRAYERLSRAYLADCPSRSFTLRNLGSRLEEWLCEHPQFAGRNPELALDMVRLEWARIWAFDGPEEQPLRLADLAALRPGLPLGLQPYVSLLALYYPVHKSRQAGTRRGEYFVAVYRADLDVCDRSLSREQFRLLAGIRGGRSVAASIEDAFKSSSIPSEDIPELLKDWFAEWGQLGWLTPPRKQRGATARGGSHK